MKTSSTNLPKLLVFTFCMLANTFFLNGAALKPTSKISYLTSNYNEDTIRNIIKIFPLSNAVNNKAIITFTVSKKTWVKIKILDVNGREIANLLDNDVPAGTFALMLETRHLKKGIYFCKFLTDEKIAMKKTIMVN